MDIKDTAINFILEKEAWGVMSYDTQIELLVQFAAEIQRQSEPTYQFRPECENWIDCTPVFYESWRGEKRTVFTFPPSVEALEDKVAEAIAVFIDAVESDWSTHGMLDKAYAAEYLINAIRSGEWKKFKKGE